MFYPEKFFGFDRSSRNANLRPFVRLLGPSLSRAVSLYLSRLVINQSPKRAIRGHSKSIQRAIRKQLDVVSCEGASRFLNVPEGSSGNEFF